MRLKVNSAVADGEDRDPSVLPQVDFGVCGRMFLGGSPP